MNKYCVIGEKLPHTMSPQIHSMFFKSMGIEGEYGVREFSREEIAGARGELDLVERVLPHQLLDPCGDLDLYVSVKFAVCHA